MARIALPLLVLSLLVPVAVAETQSYTLQGCESAGHLFCRFEIPVDASTATVTMEDAVFGNDACFSIQWRFADGSLQSGTIRGVGVETYTIPDGAVEMNVFMGHIRTVNCAFVQGFVTPPTVGSVTVDWA